MRNPDVIIVGTGAAGLFCALHLPRSCQILMVTKDKAENSDSFLAQGGICTLRDEADFAGFYEDTLRAGHYANNPASVETMIRSAPSVIRDLEAFGVRFDREGEQYAYTREGAHSRNRILHYQDVTGREITGKLLDEARRRENISIAEDTAMADIFLRDNRCGGIILRGPGGEILAVQAQAVVWATGGIGGLFRNSTNFPHLTADALAIALIHGIRVQDISAIQIHPTVLYTEKPGRRFLISESVRGEGAYLLNSRGERFVDELLARDVVSNAILQQMEREGSNHVYLSVTHLDGEKFRARFPNIFQTCLEEGYDMGRVPIPVVPAQHYYMGGVWESLDGETSLDGLYAVGEAGCNGVHGKNRLASNSLLESLVFSRRAAGKIAGRLSGAYRPEEGFFMPPRELEQYRDGQALQKKYRDIVLRELKRKDRDFYDKWFHDADPG